MSNRFTVVIPAYNEERYISKCLKSLKEQDYAGFLEVIVVNNASTDHTREVAESFGAKVVDEPQKGISYALIKGCREAQGDIFVFTDADTTLPKNWISEISKRFDDDPALVAVGGPYLFYDADDAVNFFVKNFVFRIYETMAKHMPPCLLPCVNMAVKRHLYEKAGGFNPVVNWGQDIDLSKRLNDYGKVKFDGDITVITSFRRYSGGNKKKPMIAAHAFKELCIQLTRCFLVANTGKVYSKTQKEVRELDENRDS
ncbi:MAG: glycosyltransferase family A protein [Candidatus Colwellbacteria bacterium]|nr:glycosyltransferase family A protein [Candidatus Colwellbacteria bacterium]